MSIYKKLLDARKKIHATPLKKGGQNTFSKYDYFTPSQVSELVATTCQELDILTAYSLRANEFGYFGELTITDIETNEALTFTMVTAMPEIKATNIAQQLGGMATYSERYLKMSVFEIVDNNLDFDAQDNRPKTPATKVLSQADLDAKERAKIVAFLKNDALTLDRLDAFTSSATFEKYADAAEIINLVKKRQTEL